MSYHFETPALLNSYEIKHGFSEIRYALDIEQKCTNQLLPLCPIDLIKENMLWK